jgi:hypothetical protein
MYSPHRSTRNPAAGPVRRPLRIGATALAVLIGTAGCAYASTPGGSVSSTTSSAGTSSSSTPSARPTGTGTPTTPVVNPGGPVAGVTSAPQAAAVPSGSKLVVFEGVTRSGDGMTLYLAAMAGGGACGKYDVVVQESSGTVKLGLAHLATAKATICPMFVRMEQFQAHLSSPLADRQVVDMADDQVVGTGNSIAVLSANVPKLPG